MGKKSVFIDKIKMSSSSALRIENYEHDGVVGLHVLHPMILKPGNRFIGYNGRMAMYVGVFL